jgi:hypothetical protein
VKVIRFPRHRRYGTHPAGRALTDPAPVVRVVDGRVWTSGASVADVAAALAGWVELARLNPSGLSGETVVSVPTPRGEDAS